MKKKKLNSLELKYFVYLSTETTVAQVLRHTNQTLINAGLQVAQVLADHLREEGGMHILQLSFWHAAE